MMSITPGNAASLWAAAVSAAPSTSPVSANSSCGKYSFMIGKICLSVARP